MYAIINSDGHQRRVAPGDVVWLEKQDGDVGDKLSLTDVLLINDGETTTVGTPSVDGAAVEAEILRQGRDRKVTVYKYKRRKGYERKKGHRQYFTEARVLDISLNGKPVAAKAAAAAEDKE